MKCNDNWSRSLFIALMALMLALWSCRTAAVSRERTAAARDPVVWRLDAYAG